MMYVDVVLGTLFFLSAREEVVQTRLIRLLEEVRILPSREGILCERDGVFHCLGRDGNWGKGGGGGG